MLVNVGRNSPRRNRATGNSAASGPTALEVYNIALRINYSIMEERRVYLEDLLIIQFLTEHMEEVSGTY